MLNVPGEAKLIGHGVSTCATCDGFFFRNQKIVVVGGGDSALEEASFLTRFGETVTVVHRRKELRASKIMQDRAFANDKIDFIWDSVVTEVLGDGKVSGVALTNVVTGEQSTLETSGVFVAIGHVPNTSVFVGELDMDENGYIKTERGHPDQRRRRVRVRRRPGPHLPPGHHLGGVGVYGRHRRRALARGPGRRLTASPALTAQRAGSGQGRECRAQERCFRYVRYTAHDQVSKEDRFMSEGITALSDATFDEHVKAADTPVLVDFWAEWCGPCKMIAPVLEEISAEHKGKIQIAKLNIDENLDVTRRYEVMSIPTLMLFKDGEPVERIIGARGKAQLLQELQAYL